MASLISVFLDLTFEGARIYVHAGYTGERLEDGHENLEKFGKEWTNAGGRSESSYAKGDGGDGGIGGNGGIIARTDDGEIWSVLRVEG